MLLGKSAEVPGGGGTSYVIDSGIIFLTENSKGTNNDIGLCKILPTVRPLWDFWLMLEGHIPTTYKGTKPDGTDGTKFEPINTLTGKRRQLFNGDNTATVYKLLRNLINRWTRYWLTVQSKP